MVSKREKAPDKRMRRIVLVICEGETEENYINLMKKWYKFPVRIVFRIEGTKSLKHLLTSMNEDSKYQQRTRLIRSSCMIWTCLPSTKNSWFVKPNCC